MATCGRCSAEVEVPPHITAGRMRCRTCGESVDVGAPAAPIAAPVPTAPARTPGAGRARGAPGTGRAGAVSLQRTCRGCGERFPAEGSPRCPVCGLDNQRARDAAEADAAQGDGWAPERAGLSAGVVGGIAMIAIAAIWFYVGYQAGVIFFYPPLLALLGIFGIFKGLADGNMAGERKESLRPRRRPRR